MPKCDTANNESKAIEVDDRLWCRRCWRESFHEDEEPPVHTCFGCHLVHLAKYMTEKLEGWRCLTCARKYEQDLLEQLTRKDDVDVKRQEAAELHPS